MTSCLLAIESSSDQCSVAVCLNGETVQDQTDQPRKHSEFILPAINRLLSAQGIGLGDLDAIVFACGPGSFTGIRIAAAITQGLAATHDLKVISVSSMAALAQGAFRKYGLTQVATCVDARMNEVYWGVYKQEGQLMALQGAEVICTPENIPVDALKTDTVVGSGVVYRERVMARYGSLQVWEALCSAQARDVITLGKASLQAGQFISVEQAVPVYLRDKVNWKKLPGR